MVNMTLQEIQDAEFLLLCEFDRVCRKNNLRYGLCGGTLLGAVRHQGFIPWDDDIDVVMPRPDYEKLMAIADDELPVYYKLAYPYNDEDTPHAYGKLQDLRTTLVEFPDSKRIETHLYVDIFPIDGMPEDCIQQERHRKKVRRRFLTLYGFKIAKYNKTLPQSLMKKLIWQIISLCDRVVPKHFFIRRVDKIVKKYAFDESKYSAVIVAGYGSREVMPHIVYGFDKEILFRDKIFKVMNKTDYYLTNLYGDYMTLPPEDQRIHHNMEVWWNEKWK